MNRALRDRAWGILAIGVTILAAGAEWAAADILNVPGDSATIQGAINLANPGDEIHVAAGTYVEQVTINKTNLVLRSTAGAATTIISFNDPNNPVVGITAGGVRLGAAGQGFTIQQVGLGGSTVAHSGGVISVRGDLINRGTTTIEGNTIRGNETDEGIVLFPDAGKPFKSSTLRVLGNTFVANGVGYAFKDAVYFHFADDPASPSIGNAAAESSIIEINDNIADELDRSAIYFGESIFATTLSVSGGTWTGTGTGEFGIRFANDIRSSSSVTINDLGIYSDFDVGLEVIDEINDSVVNIVTAEFSGIRWEGIILGRVRNDSSVLIDECPITGNGTAEKGVFASVELGSSLTVSNNTISGIQDAGVDWICRQTSSSVVISNNSITMASGGIGDGFYCGTTESGSSLVQNNQVSDFTEAGIYAYVRLGGTLTLDNNAFDGAAAGCLYGIWVDEIGTGGTATVSDNTATKWSIAGFYWETGCYGQSTFMLINNEFTALAGVGDFGARLIDAVVDESIATIQSNTFSGFDQAGIRADEVSSFANLLIVGNILQGNPATGAQYGVHVGVPAFEESGLTISNNEIQFIGGVHAAGVRIEQYTEDPNSFTEIAGNTIVVMPGSSPSHGIFFNQAVRNGGAIRCLNNHIEGYATAGLLLNSDVSASTVDADVNTFVAGHPAAIGVDIAGAIQLAAQVGVDSNCFTPQARGIRINTILDTAAMAAHANDFSATTSGIENVNGDAAHAINGNNNFWGPAVTAIGQVIATAILTAPPLDDDADGVGNCLDQCPGTPAGQTADDDGCSCLQLNPTGDADNDGVLDCNDGCPADPNKTAPGACGCGNPDTDADADLVADCNDLCPGTVAGAAVDADGCTCLQLNPTGDADADGVIDCSDQCPGTPAGQLVNSAGCSCLQLNPTGDADNDGVLDCNDGCPNDQAKVTPGECGCGAAETDSDGDSVPDCKDECPEDPNKTSPGACGCGVEDADEDADGIPDCPDDCINGVGPGCPGQPDPQCGACGAGAGAMLPLSLIGLARMRRRRRAVG